MARSLDELIEFVLGEIALRGNLGMFSSSTVLSDRYSVDLPIKNQKVVFALLDLFLSASSETLRYYLNVSGSIPATFPYFYFVTF